MSARRLFATALGLWLALALLAAAPARATEADKGIVAGLISRALSSATTQVSIGAVDGAFSSDATIRDIVLSDRDGPWLKIDTVKLVWTQSALLSRRLQVDQLDIGNVAFLRRPLPAPPDPKAPKFDPMAILPDLPLKVVVKAFAIHNLSLGPTVVGVQASLNLMGAATLGPPSEGLDLHLESHRLDAPGEFVAKVAFVPQTTALTLALNFDEPANGLLANAANVPGRPPIKLSLNGAGPLDAFKAKLDFAAGPNIGAAGGLDLARQGAGRRLTTDVQGRLSGLFPSFVAATLADPSSLQGDVFLGDDGAMAIKSLHFVTASARLDIEGGVAADRRIDIHLHAGAIPGATAIGKLDLNADFHGPLTALDAKATLEAGDLRASFGTLGSVDATFTLKPDGALGDGSTRYALAGDASYGALALVDSAQQAFFGAAAQLTFRAESADQGALHIQTFALEGETLKGEFSGDAGAKILHGRLTAQAPNLGRLAWLSPLGLGGAATLTADLDGAPDQGVYSAALDLAATRLTTGVVALDGFFGGALKLKGGVRKLADGGYGFDDLALSGLHGTAQLKGSASANSAAIHFDVDVPQAKALDPRVMGHATLTGDLTGSLAKLDASATASLRDGRLLDRAAPRLDLTLAAKDLTGALDATANLTGEIDAKALTGAFHVAHGADGGWNLDKLALGLGSARLDGNVALSATMRAEGRLALAAARLDDLSPLALTKLSGSIDSQIQLSAPEGRQTIAVVAKSPTLAVGANSAASLAVDLTLQDVFGAMLLEGNASAAKIVAAGETIGDFRLVAKADATSSDVSLKANARGLAIAAEGAYSAAVEQLRLSALTAEGHGRSLRLLKPATFARDPQGVSVDALELGLDGGRLSLAGSLGASLDIHVSATSLPLAAADIVAPGLGLQGTANGEATLKGASTAPDGDWRLKIDGLSAPALRAFAQKPLRVDGSGRFSGGRATLDVTVSAPAAGSLRLTGAAPLSAAGELDVKAVGRLDLAAANDFLSASGQRASGAAVLDATVTGTPAHPNARGALKISGASFSDDSRGVKLTGIEGAIVANGDEIDISRLHAATPQGGSLDVAGKVRLDAQAGFPGALKLTGRRAQLLSTDVVTAVADLALSLDGALARNPRVSGRVDLKTLEITIPGNLSGADLPLSGVRHIDPGPTARARLALAARDRGTGKAAAPFDASLALTISAPSRVFVRGRGVDAELGGDLRIAGTTMAPQVNGGFDLLRGSLNLLGNALTFTRGRAQFHNDTMPDLDLVAQTTAADVTAYVAVTGPANMPVFTFTSSPSLPQDEILSRILFQQASGNLSAFQALQLANAVAALSGRGDAFEQVRKSLGVDSFNVTTDSSGGPVVGVQRAINDRLSLGLKSGARPEDNGVTLDLNVTKHLRLQGGVDASGGSSVGVGTQYEY